MNRGTILAAGLAAVFAVAFVLSGQSAFAATVNADIVKDAASKTTDAFSPNPIQASPGDTVVWTNKDTAIHTVTSGTPSNPEKTFGVKPDGTPELIAPQKTFQFTFAQAGDFPYYCQLHPAMVGTVKVAAAAGGGTTGGGTTGGPATPEFGPVAALVLAVSLVAVIGFARFRGNSLGLGRF
jgi:plastocyanin